MAEPTRTRLVELLDYSPETGVFFWKKRTGRCSAGKPGGTVTKWGYVRIRIDGRPYAAHRLAFLWMTGSIPPEVDHINGDRADNRWANLRPATNQQNKWNRVVQSRSRTGVKGVCGRTDGRFEVRIRRDGTNKYIGSYRTLAEAKSAYDTLAREIHGEFFRA